MTRSTLPADSPSTQPDESLVRPALSSGEARVHRCVEILSQGRCRILIKPRLVDFLVMKGTLGAKAMAETSMKKLDFLLCRFNDWTPMVGIELFDSSTESEHIASRDSFVHSYLKIVGIPLLRIEVKELDHAESFRDKLLSAWNRRQSHLEEMSNPENSGRHSPAAVQQRQQRTVLSFIAKSPRASAIETAPGTVSQKAGADLLALEDPIPQLERDMAETLPA